MPPKKADAARLDVTKLKVKEIIDIEEVTGINVTDMKPGDPLPFKAFAAVAWVLERRTNADATYEEFGELYPEQLTERAEKAIEVLSAENPTKGGS